MAVVRININSECDFDKLLNEHGINKVEIKSYLHNHLGNQFDIEIAFGKISNITPVEYSMWDVYDKNLDIIEDRHNIISSCLCFKPPHTDSIYSDNLTEVELNDANFKTFLVGIATLNRDLFNSAVNPKFYYGRELFPDLPMQLSFDYKSNEIVNTPHELMFALSLVKSRQQPIMYSPHLWVLRYLIYYPFYSPLFDMYSVKLNIYEVFKIFQHMMVDSYIPLYYILDNKVYTRGQKLEAHLPKPLKLIINNFVVVYKSTLCVNSIIYTTNPGRFDAICVTKAEFEAIQRDFEKMGYEVCHIIRNNAE